MAPLAAGRWLVAGALCASCGGGARPPAVPGGDAEVPDRLAAQPTTTPADQAPSPSLGETRKTRDRKPQDATLLHTLAPVRGFIDTPIAFDAPGRRLLYVNTDAADLCELVVWDLETRTEVARIDLKPFTTAPLAVEAVTEGDRFLVLAKGPTDGTVVGAVLDGKGAVTRKLGPATDIARARYDGQEVVTVYQRAEVPGRKKADPPAVRHTVEVLALASGKRIGKRAVVSTDAAGYSKKLDFKINHWLDGYTRAVGIKGGDYDRGEDQRSPSVEAWYDVPRATFGRKQLIADLVEHARLFQVLAQRPNEASFVMVAPDLSGLALHAGGLRPTPIELAEPFRHYLHTSLVTQPAEPGQPLFFTLEIDPVHPDAVARKRAEERWLDLYALPPDGKRAARVARLPLEDGQPGYRWRARPGRWVVIPRHVGFERGGKSLLIYQTGAGAPPSKAGAAQP